MNSEERQNRNRNRLRPSGTYSPRRASPRHSKHFRECNETLDSFMGKLIEAVGHYDVRIEPSDSEAVFSTVLLKFFKQYFSHVDASIAFDGTKKVYTSASLQVDSFEGEITLSQANIGMGKEAKYTVYIQENRCAIDVKFYIQK